MSPIDGRQKGIMMIQIRRMGPDEVERLSELDVSEEGDIVYKWVHGEVVAVREKWTRRRWSDDECSRRIARIGKRITEEGASMVGALDDELLVGVAVFNPRLSPGMSELAGLWVSCTHRRRGVATRLVAELERRARETGSAALYVSATPSRSAVGFYRSRGFRPTLDANPELYERQPEDIHMVLDLLRMRWQAAESRGQGGRERDMP
jgi:N-acetylglutamate synthase-like GNAT family acetyltransferase